MKLLTTKSFVTFLLSLFLVAVMFDVASANDNVVAKDKKSVVSTVKTEKTKENKSSKVQEKAALQKVAASTAKKNVNTTSKPTIKQKKIKQDNSESVLSYNFIFYLVYEFKFSDIINFDKGGESQNTIDRPFEDILYDKGKSLFNWLIYTISY